MSFWTLEGLALEVESLMMRVTELENALKDAKIKVPPTAIQRAEEQEKARPRPPAPRR